jgi:quercetin dioxygenase-like cupin family protein
MVLGILMAAVPALAQEGDCPAIAQTALAETGEVCSETARNQVCYGNIQLEATARAGVPDLAFSQPGDIINAGDVQSLRLSPLSEAGRTWGVAMMKLQANLPGTLPGQNVTFVLFGDVEVTNAENNNEAAEAPPLQAFYFKTGLNDAPCDAAPDSGLMLQTPEGAGKVHFRANEVEITLGSTAYLQAQPEGDMTVSVLEGQVTLEAFGAAVTIPAGSRAAVPMDDQMRASGPPEEAEPYDPSELAALPVSLLERAVTIEATPEATVEAGSGLVPAAGQWVWVNGEVSEEGCMAGVSTMILTQLTPRDPFDLPGGEFSMEGLLSAAYQGRSLAGAVYSEPEPGLYAVDFPSMNGNGHFEARVISATRMEGLMIMSGEGCVINIPFEILRGGA